MGTMTTDFLQQSTVQKGAVEEMRTERTKLLTASAGRGGNVDDGGNDIHDPSPDVMVVGLTGDECDDENDAAATPGGLRSWDYGGVRVRSLFGTKHRIERCGVGKDRRER